MSAHNGSYVAQALMKSDLTGEWFRCMVTKRGFKCGICKRGNLTLSPYKGQRCMCCHNPVAQIILSTEVTLDDLPRLAF